MTKKVYRVFTVDGEDVYEGARVESFKFNSVDIGTSAIIVGEKGRGRRLGVIAVQGARPSGEDPLLFAEVGRTGTDRPKFTAREAANTDDEIIVVLRTRIGFMGGNSHTGDRRGWICACGEEGSGGVPEDCPNGNCNSLTGPLPRFTDFPGDIIVAGRIAQGDTGRMGWGCQYVSIIPKGVVFRTGYYGHLYDAPGSYYYLWDGEQLLVATWTERVYTGIF